MLLDAFTRGAETHPKIKATLQEYATNNLGYYPLHIKTDDMNVEITHLFQFGGVMWKSEEGIEVRPFDFSQASDLNDIELSVYPSGTKVIRNKTAGNIYYNSHLHMMWKPCKSRFERFGFISMNMDSKSPEPTGIECSRNFDQFTSLSKLMTTRYSKDRVAFESDCFLKSIGEVVYTDYESRSGKSIRPVTLLDDIKGIRTTTSTDFNTGKKVHKKSYTLTDLVLVIDIDNGTQIEYIKESLLNLPFTPQYITQEIGLGETKRGNATALLVVDTPMTKEQRQLLLKAFRYVLCCKYDVYAIDYNCTGVGYGKNPLKTFKGERQRNFYTLVNNGDYRTTTNLSEILSWASDILSIYEPFMNEADDKFISSCEELKNSCLKYSEIINKLNQTKSEVSFTATSTSIFSEYVPKGSRNDQFVRIEGPIYALQYYLLHGLDSIQNDLTAAEILFRIKSDVLKRYDNSDHTITNKWLLNKLQWILEQDREALRSCDKRRELLSRAHYQRNICIHNNECRMMALEGYTDFKESRFKVIKEFAELGLQHRYTATQQRHGADTQSIKSMLYASAKLGPDLTEILNYLRTLKSNTPKLSTTDVAKLLPPTDVDKTRRHTVANVLLSKLEAESVMHEYEARSGFGFQVEHTRKSKRDNRISFWDFSLKHNKKFMDIEAENRSQLEYHIALYINEFCNNILRFGADKCGCKFGDIKSADVRSICRSLYSKFGVNISIVHHIAVSIKEAPKTPHQVFVELCTMNTREVANKLGSIYLKHVGFSDAESEMTIGHRYRPDTVYSGDIKKDVFDLLNNVIGKASSTQEVKRWISEDLLSHIRTLIQNVKQLGSKPFDALYKVIRRITNAFLVDILHIEPEVVTTITRIKKGLINYFEEKETGSDSLNSNKGLSAEIYSRIKHLQVVQTVA